MDFETDDDVNERFKQAASFVQSNIKSFDNDQLLLFYGFYKQSTEGSCNSSKPSWYELEAKEKWNAWNKLDDMTKTEAMKEYIALLTSTKPGWEASAGGSTENKSSSSWISVSCMIPDEEALHPDQKTPFDWVKEGNVDMLEKTLDPSVLDKLDESGMGLIHWAADRGDVSIMQSLLNLSPDIDLIDESGQTALHYASACGHKDIVNLLLDKGASTSIKDSEGQTPAEVAFTEDIRTLFSQST